MPFTLTSPAFKHQGTIPATYTCDGKNISPLLQWNEPPKGTQSFALINDDPDCSDGAFTHWIIYNLPPHHRELKENFPKDPELPDGTLQGYNDFKKIGYAGPCPPSGVHRYFFKLYALSVLPAISPRASKSELETAMKGHILASAELIGLYKRSKKA